MSRRKFAVVTGASTGIGLELARLAAGDGKTGYEAMMKGERSVIHGLINKLQVAGATLLGGGVSAEMGRKLGEPGSASE